MNEHNANPQEKKWTEWSVVSMGDGTLRCKRTNVADEKDAEYRQVPAPTFSREEMAGMVEFGNLGLLTPEELSDAVYGHRYRLNAFRMCSQLNGPMNGAK